MTIPNAKIFNRLFCLCVCILALNFAAARAQEASGAAFVLTADALADGKIVALDKNAAWRFRAGDDAAWAEPDFDDSGWQTIADTRLKPHLLASSDWRGRAWLRLKIRVEENLVRRPLALTVRQNGATEFYLDGQKFARFGEIGAATVEENNPNNLPVPFRFERAGEHTLAVRYASETFADPNALTARWLLGGNLYPTLTPAIRDAGDWNEVVNNYAGTTSMRVGFLFVGVLLALALLHLLLYLFYRAGRANLFYSLYAGGLGIFVFCNNINYNGHLSGVPTAILRVVSSGAFAVAFVGLLAFVYVAFGRRLGKIFWAMAALWALNFALIAVFLLNLGVFSSLTSVLIGLTFTFSIHRLVAALRAKQTGAWILFAGVQLLALGMFSTLINESGLINLPRDVFIAGEFVIVLALPIAVSVFLARNFARTNRDLQAQLAQVELLSAQKIEQERRAADLRAENERRAKELEEARQLQLSMLPRKLPQLPNLEIAAYMKPATEVGGDYYDFHVAKDGTLTVAVGDATGHGLKAGSVVTATKSLFNAFASEPDITQIFRRSTRALKAMNLRGLFMAMTVLKIKNDKISISAAGMPAALVYRADVGAVEEINIKAMPLGSIADFAYRQQEIVLQTGDCVLLMSDGFPEMFNPENEMLGFDAAARILPQVADRAAQEIINRFVEAGDVWAGARPADDDVTFVVLKMV